MTEIRKLVEERELEGVMAEETAVLYKHSANCALGWSALRQMRRFAEACPAVPVYMVDVQAQRAVSDAIERRLRVEHESPQAILLRRGTVAWAGSHFDVTASSLATHLDSGP